MRTIALFIVAALLVAGGASAASAKCKPIERETTVCQDGRKILRIIRQSISPTKRYAVGWTVEDGKNAKANQEMADLEEDQRQADEPVGRSFSTENRDHVWNYLVRLSDGKALKRLDGEEKADMKKELEELKAWAAGLLRAMRA